MTSVPPAGIELLRGQDWLYAGVTTRESETAFLEGVAAGPIRAIAAARQVHGAGVVQVTGPPRTVPAEPARLPGDAIDRPASARGAGAPEGWRFGAADALMTSHPGVMIAVSVADCLPVILADPQHRAVGVAHAGWRGLAAGVISSLAASMSRAFGSRAAVLLAGMGPSIGPCCYEVGDDVVAVMRAAGRDAVFTSRGARPRLDLAATAERELTRLGVRAASIERLDECTACRPERFFSRRRDGAILGRMWGFAVVR